MRYRRALISVSLFAIAACKPADAPPQNGAASTPSTSPRVSAANVNDGATSAPAPVAAAGAITIDSGNTARPAHKLTIAEARRYMLALVNRDRKTQNLPPVVLDEGPPSIAGQGHAEDMAHLGYLGHWGSDGSVPEERLTRAGGADFDMENASCFVDQKVRPLDSAPQIDPADVETSESMFFNEQPPNDGHRKNILKPSHTRLGIGIAQPVRTETEIPVPCFSQEFIDGYGTYDPIPQRAKLGDRVHVSGKTTPFPTAVGMARIDSPRPIPVPELNTRRTYAVPTPYSIYWQKGFVTEIPLDVKGDQFSIDVTLADKARSPGLYEISVWSKLPGNKDHTMVSLRTVLVE